MAQSAVVGVYGQGFDRVKNHRKLNLKELKERVANESSNFVTVRQFKSEIENDKMTNDNRDNVIRVHHCCNLVFAFTNSYIRRLHQTRGKPWLHSRGVLLFQHRESGASGVLAGL